MFVWFIFCMPTFTILMHDLIAGKLVNSANLILLNDYFTYLLWLQTTLSASNESEKSLVYFRKP